ncbi:DUF4184 family protein [Psychrobacter sp. P2G3]|uniref:DUF4184 family protein n=1 Tax=Psychrobacter sp. P2G3 TaxID=1699622 RepID=UPI00078B35A0|nr:DUF4184 family protein [Psychrobacter sp. P2G3]AMN49104.1 hypothetical protein AK823_03740 [Psychrobacter sp. P2G3]
MAFTLSHMAAALPFYRSKNKNHSMRWFQFDALLIGTMMPDLHYYINIGSSLSRQSHEWTGLFTYNLPWGLAVFTLWYWGLKPAAFALVRPFLKELTVGNFIQPNKEVNEERNKVQRRFIGYADKIWSFANIRKRVMHKVKSFYLPVVLGLIVGAATHLIWDGITHADGFIAQRIDWLQYPLYFYPFKGTSIARILQYLSSMAGLVILAWFATSRLQIWKRSNNSSEQATISDAAARTFFTKKQSLTIIGLMATLSLVWIVQTSLKWYPSLSGSPYRFAAKVSVSVLPNIAVLCIGYAVIYHLIYLSRYAFRKK